MTSINSLVIPTSQRYPHIVATGFTTAYLGDERSLREFIVGDYICSQIAQSKGNCLLYLINDSYDPLKHSQLRIVLNKDEKMLAQFEHFCGCPIAEVPDPFGCHESYSQHFSDALLKRLHHLDIHPVLLDTYQAYQKGYYNPFIETTLENYSQIQEAIAREFDSLIIHDLLNIKCPQCQHMDATHIHKVTNGKIQLECNRCNMSRWYESGELQGKLSWKLDCAARWNLYKIDVETFSKTHLSPKSTFAVSQFVSKNFYGGNIPVPVKYGTVHLDKEVSYNLINILPPVILKKLFLKHFNRDIKITKDSVENFCHKFHIQPGVSYIDYIQKELQKHAIRTVARENMQAIDVSHSSEEILAFYGKRFAKFYYNKDHFIGFPNLQSLATADAATARTARDIIHYVLSVRDEHQTEEANTLARISVYLKDRRKAPTTVVQYIRRILGQPQGLRLSILLTLFPSDYLRIIQIALDFYVNMHLPVKEHSRIYDSVDESAKLASILSKSISWVNLIPDLIDQE